jgi:hypothetical protein
MAVKNTRLKKKASELFSEVYETYTFEQIKKKLKDKIKVKKERNVLAGLLVKRHLTQNKKK